MDLGPYQTRIIETAIAVGTYLLLRSTARSLIRATLVRSVFKSREEKEVGRLINVLLFLVLAVVLSAIWGVEQSEILLFVSSVITVLGVALFAEMSILSNITACLVLFFQHPVKIGDRIRVFDGDNWVEGELMDITYFFVFIRTDREGTVSIPNAILLKNAFHIVDQAPDERSQ
jgi:small-conductance mechanosensitive channel